MMKRFHPENVPAASGPYSAGIAVGGLLFLAGQGPFNAKGERVGDTFEDQVRATFENLERVANDAGTSLSNAVRIGAYLTTLDNFAKFNEVMAEYVSEPYPVRTTIPVELRGFDIEIDAILSIPEAD